MARLKSGQTISSAVAEPEVEETDVATEVESDEEPQIADPANLEFAGEMHEHPELLAHLDAAKAATYDAKSGEGDSTAKEAALAKAVEFLNKVQAEFGPKSEVADKVRRVINVARGVK